MFRTLQHPQLRGMLSLQGPRMIWKFFEYMQGSVKEPNKFHIYETEKITRKASDAAEYIELFGSFTRDRHAPTHLVLFSERPPIYALSCMTISGERTEQLVVIGFGELAAVD